eukprot:8784169-Alexandrium_andersonii.AAC.1
MIAQHLRGIGIGPIHEGWGSRLWHRATKVEEGSARDRGRERSREQVHFGMNAVRPDERSACIRMNAAQGEKATPVAGLVLKMIATQTKVGA